MSSGNIQLRSEDDDTFISSIFLGRIASYWTSCRGPGFACVQFRFTWRNTGSAFKKPRIYLPPSCIQRGILYKRVSLVHLQPDVALTDTSKSGLGVSSLWLFKSCLWTRSESMGNPCSLSLQSLLNTIIYWCTQGDIVTLSLRIREHTSRPVEQNSNRSEGIVTLSLEIIRVYSRMRGSSYIDLDGFP